MSKGSVFMVNSWKLDLIFSRFTVHKSGIPKICYLNQYQRFISIDEKLNLHVIQLVLTLPQLWKIDGPNKKIQCLFKTNVFSEIKYILPLTINDQFQRMVIGYDCGALELME